MKRVLVIAVAIFAIVGISAIFEYKEQRHETKRLAAQKGEAGLKGLRSCGDELKIRLDQFGNAEEARLKVYAVLALQVEAGKPTEAVARQYVEGFGLALERYKAGLETYDRCRMFASYAAPVISEEEARKAAGFFEKAHGLLEQFKINARKEYEVVDKALFKLYGKHAPPLPDVPKPNAFPRIVAYQNKTAPGVTPEGGSFVMALISGI